MQAAPETKDRNSTAVDRESPVDDRLSPLEDRDSLTDYSLISSPSVEVMADSTSSNGPGGRFGHLSNVILSEDGRNYLAWSTVVTVLLQQAGDAYGVVNKTIDQTNTKYAVANVTAKAVILNSLSQGLIASNFSNTIADKNAAEMWTTLQDKYAAKSGIAQNAAMTQFFSFKYNPSKTLSQNIDKFQRIMQTVTLADSSVSDKIACQKLLQSLPASWEAIRLFWSSKSDTDQTLTNLYALLLGEAVRRESMQQSDPTALFSNLSIRHNRHQYRPNNRFQGNRNRNFSNNNRQFYQYNNQNQQQQSNYSAPAQQQNRNPNNQINRPSWNSNSAPRQRPNYHGNRSGQSRPRRSDHPSAHFAESGDPFEEDVEVFAASASEHIDQTSWLLDSGASHNICNDGNIIRNYVAYGEPRPVKVGGAQKLQALGQGDVFLLVDPECGGALLQLEGVLYVPDMRRNLISMAALITANWQITTTKTAVHLNRDLANLEIPMAGGLFALRARSVTVPTNAECLFTTSRTLTLQKAHEILGHINKRQVREFLAREGIPYRRDQIDCVACIRGKMNRSSYHSKPTNSMPQSLGYITTDLCGPMSTLSRGGAKYFMNLHDHFSKFNKLFLLKSKDEAHALI